MEPFLPDSMLDLLQSYGPREFDRMTQGRCAAPPAATVTPAGAVELHAADAQAVVNELPSQWPMAVQDATAATLGVPVSALDRILRTH